MLALPRTSSPSGHVSERQAGVVPNLIVKAPASPLQMFRGGISRTGKRRCRSPHSREDAGQTTFHPLSFQALSAAAPDRCLSMTGTGLSRLARHRAARFRSRTCRPLTRRLRARVQYTVIREVDLA